MKFVLIAICMLFASAAEAEVTGNDLLAKLQSKDPVDNNYAYYYIIGVTDSENSAVIFEVINSYEPKAKVGKKFTRDYFCSPTGSTNKQAFDVIQQYLEGHPANRQWPAVNLIRISLIEAWPCSGNPPARR